MRFLYVLTFFVEPDQIMHQSLVIFVQEKSRNGLVTIEIYVIGLPLELDANIAGTLSTSMSL